jgi:predicted DCC family thiol-disulfide oxidoreductase YuxK
VLGAPPPLTVLYDADCGFCRFSVARLLDWDRRRRLRPVAIQSARGQELLAAVAPAERLRSAHVVDAEGTLHSGGAAAAVIARELPAGAPVALVLGALPGPTDRAYRFVADHRTGISRFVPSRWKRAAAAQIARRSD